jgi:DNA-damage-inducible protein D
MNQISNSTDGTFESIRRENAVGGEFWLGRELAELLDYTDYEVFEGVVARAEEACVQSGYQLANHFEIVGDGEDVRLSRYACYLVVQNADPAKPVIARGQTYFAVQTRRQELADEEAERVRQREEEQRRVLLRREMKSHNKQLSEAAAQAGVVSGGDFATFQNHGYMGLYGGLDAKGVHRQKGLKKSQQILDHMGSTELAANLFRATQTEDKLRRDRVRGKALANKTHQEVGAKVRQTIAEIGGTMPENLPTPEISVRTLEKRRPNR